MVTRTTGLFFYLYKTVLGAIKYDSTERYAINDAPIIYFISIDEIKQEIETYLQQDSTPIIQNLISATPISTKDWENIRLKVQHMVEIQYNRGKPFLEYHINEFHFLEEGVTNLVHVDIKNPLYQSLPIFIVLLDTQNGEK